MKVAIGVATFNRKHLVNLGADSLCSSILPQGTELLVIDDCSSEYDVSFLRSIYPQFAKIHRNNQNSGGASFCLRDIMLRLLSTDADALLLLDSDMLVSREFLIVSTNLLPQTDGILSLFNTPNHSEIGNRGSIALKKAVGSAGTLWKRELALTVLNAVPAGVEFDWRFSQFMNERNIEICAMKKSLVQHIGFSTGQNHTHSHGDIGVGFEETCARNSYRAIELLMFDSQAKFRELQRQIEGQLEDFQNRNADLQNLNADLQNRVVTLEKLPGVRSLKRIRRIFRADK